MSIAYAASLGGFATLIGTPPNIYFAGYMRSQGLPIDFGRWMLFATPLSLVYLLIAWLLLTRVLFPVRLRHIPGGRELILDEYRKLGSVSRGEWIVLIVFLCTAALWIVARAAGQVGPGSPRTCPPSSRSMTRWWRWPGRSRCS